MWYESHDGSQSKTYEYVFRRMICYNTLCFVDCHMNEKITKLGLNNLCLFAIKYYMKLLIAIFISLLSKLRTLWSACVLVYVVYEDTDLYNDMGMT